MQCTIQLSAIPLYKCNFDVLTGSKFCIFDTALNTSGICPVQNCKHTSFSDNADRYGLCEHHITQVCKWTSTIYNIEHLEYELLQKFLASCATSINNIDVYLNE